MRGPPEIAFSSEPSHFGVVTVLLALLHYQYCENRVWRVVLSASAIIVALFSGSKGAVAALTLSFALVLFIQNYKRKGFLIFGLPLIMASCAIMFAFVARMLTADIENFTSVTTRSAGFLTALLTSCDYPFGVGLGGFYPAFSSHVPQAWNMLTALAGSKLNLGELFRFAYGDDRNLSSKTLLGDWLIYFGWPAVLLLLVAYFKLFKVSLASKSRRGDALPTIVCFSFIASTTYYVGIPHYILPMALGLVWRQARNA